jgi:hypothetical protein
VSLLPAREGEAGVYVPRRRRSSPGRKWAGVALAVGGGWLVVRVLPFWIWPVGMGLWLLWAGLGPLVVGGALVWVGWRLWVNG